MTAATRAATRHKLEIERHIRAITAWLADHTPREDWTSGQHQAYNDRLTGLAAWLAKSQLAERADR